MEEITNIYNIMNGTNYKSNPNYSKNGIIERQTLNKISYDN